MGGIVLDPNEHLKDQQGAQDLKDLAETLKNKKKERNQPRDTNTF